jgi:hypothetical protein
MIARIFFLETGGELKEPRLSNAEVKGGGCDNGLVNPATKTQKEVPAALWLACHYLMMTENP